jgi:hypothetical protein
MSERASVDGTGGASTAGLGDRGGHLAWVLGFGRRLATCSARSAASVGVALVVGLGGGSWRQDARRAAGRQPLGWLPVWSVAVLRGGCVLAWSCGPLWSLLTAPCSRRGTPVRGNPYFFTLFDLAAGEPAVCRGCGQLERLWVLDLCPAFKTDPRSGARQPHGRLLAWS